MVDESAEIADCPLFSRLREHLSAVIALMKASNTWGQLMRAINRALPPFHKQMDLPAIGYEEEE